MFFALLYDSTGACTGVHAYGDQPASYPAGEIACTKDQSLNPSLHKVVSGVLADNLPAYQTAQNTILDAACKAAISAGFSSSALGTAHTYPSTETDQRNLLAAAGSAAASSLWCKDGSGTWALVSHTQAQAQAVLADFNAFRNTAQAKLVTLEASAAAATTAAAIQAVVWN